MAELLTKQVTDVITVTTGQILQMEFKRKHSQTLHVTSHSTCAKAEPIAQDTIGTGSCLRSHSASPLVLVNPLGLFIGHA